MIRHQYPEDVLSAAATPDDYRLPTASEGSPVLPPPGVTTTHSIGFAGPSPQALGHPLMPGAASVSAAVLLVPLLVAMLAGGEAGHRLLRFGPVGHRYRAYFEKLRFLLFWQEF